LSRNKQRLQKIKNEKKRNAEESQLLWDAAAEVELEEEEAAKRAAAVKIEYDDKGNPVTDNIQDD
jgi:hypothetical protein